MFLKAHVTTAYLTNKFSAKGSTLHKYIVGMKYKIGGASGTTYKTSEEWMARQQKEAEDVGEAGGLSLTQEDLPASRGTGKKSGKKRDAAEIRGDSSKPKKKSKDNDNKDVDEDEDRNKPSKAPVTRRGIVIHN